MTSREAILSAVKKNQPALKPKAGYDESVVADEKALLAQYIEVLQFIGGRVFTVSSVQEAQSMILQSFGNVKKVFSTDKRFNSNYEIDHSSGHSLADLNLCILKSSLAVAENGAVWLPEQDLPHRVLPFITEHLVVIIDKKAIVRDMHEAYKVIGDSNYGYGVFVAGPSKTADIEQSLVLGAHGAISMTVFIMTGDADQ
jgi:L-lactate dehydrogenase complex protein LldG